MKLNGKKGDGGANELVSFKLAKSIYRQLIEYAEGQTEEEGIELSPSQAARKLMLESLKRWREQQKS